MRFGWRELLVADVVDGIEAGAARRGVEAGKRSHDFQSLFIRNVAVDWLLLAHFLTTVQITASPPGFSQAFRS